MELVEKYRANFPTINEDRPTDEVSSLKVKISDFHTFVKKALSVMGAQKD